MRKAFQRKQAAFVGGVEFQYEEQRKKSIPALGKA